MKAKYDKKDEEEIVLVVNEICHDLEENYEKENSVMHMVENNTWKAFLRGVNFKNKKILEIGTGTGFLPLFFIKNQIQFDEFTCTDISKNILLKAENNIIKENSKQNLRLNFKFKKLDGKNLPFDDNSYDIVIMNSVLHHLPDVKYFFKDSSRVLNKDGLLIIGHEPNFYFYNSIFLFFNYRLLGFFFKVLGKFRNFILNKSSLEETTMINKVNLQLKKRNLIKSDLNLKEIGYFVDYGAGKGLDYKKTYGLFFIKSFYK